MTPFSHPKFVRLLNVIDDNFNGPRLENICERFAQHATSAVSAPSSETTEVDEPSFRDDLDGTGLSA
jgi:hypothetical protein